MGVTKEGKENMLNQEDRPYAEERPMKILCTTLEIEDTRKGSTQDTRNESRVL